MGTQAETFVLPHYPADFARAPRYHALIVASAMEEIGTIAALVESSGGVEVVGKSNDIDMTLHMAVALKPELIVLDLDIAHADVFHAATQIKMLVPGAKVLLVSARDDVELGLSALDAGADAFLCKRHLPLYCRSRIAPLLYKTALQPR